MRIGSSGGLITNPTTGGHAVFNEAGVDADFRVESDTDANALFVQGSDGFVGIGTGSLAYKLNVAGTDGTAYTPTGASARTPTGTLQQTITSSGTTGVASIINMTANGTHAWIGAVDTGSGYAPNMVFGQSTGPAAWAERGRFDTSGNFLVGKTTSSLADAGLFFNVGGGYLGLTSDGGPSLYLNRLTSDGDIAVFRKDGTTVGSIGTGGGRPYFVANDGSTGGGFKVDSTQFYPVDRTGAVSNGALDLGYSSGRWKDLYLSGGIQGAAAGSIVINEAGLDVDFRVESDTNTHMLFVDAGLNRVGIGISAPASILHLNQDSGGAIYIESNILTTDTVPAWSAATVIGEIHAGSGGDGGLLRLSAGGGVSAGQKAGIDMSGYNTTDGGPNLRFYAGSLKAIIGESSTVFNEDGQNQDFRVESDTNTHMLFVDAGNSFVGVGTSAPQAPLHILSTTGLAPQIMLGQTSAYRFDIGYSNTYEYGWMQAYGVNTSTYDDIVMNRLGGNVLVGTDSSSAKLYIVNDGGTGFPSIRADNNSASYTGHHFWSVLGGTANDNTTAIHVAGYTQSGNRFIIYGNGNMVNTNNSYGAISDVKLKENIIDASSQWDDIKAVTIRKYSMKEDNLDAPNMLGVIAQELEAAGMGGLVFESPDRDSEGEILDTTTKQVNYSILYMKAVKALQEAMTRIETLEAKVSALEA
jgi:hypothetical protein